MHGSPAKGVHWHSVNIDCFLESCFLQIQKVIKCTCTNYKMEECGVQCFVLFKVTEETTIHKMFGGSF